MCYDKTKSNKICTYYLMLTPQCHVYAAKCVCDLYTSHSWTKASAHKHRSLDECDSCRQKSLTSGRCQ